jgi:hypothetical protein
MKLIVLNAKYFCNNDIENSLLNIFTNDKITKQYLFELCKEKKRFIEETWRIPVSAVDVVISGIYELEEE